MKRPNKALHPTAAGTDAERPRVSQIALDGLVAKPRMAARTCRSVQWVSSSGSTVRIWRRGVVSFGLPERCRARVSALVAGSACVVRSPPRRQG